MGDDRSSRVAARLAGSTRAPVEKRRAAPRTRGTPRYLRFAQALALCGAMTTETTACTRCGDCMCPGSGSTDAGFLGDAGGGPLPAGDPVCDGEATSRCCNGIPGPLAPPDLPA